VYTWRMPSDHFSKIQHALRTIKSQHGIDLLNPRGVTIGDKQYPAVHKQLYIDDGTGGDHYGNSEGFFVQIPFESGNRLRINGGNHGYLDSHLLVPTIHLNSNGEKSYWHATAYHLGADAGFFSHKNPDHRPDKVHLDLHEVINNTAKLPTQGTYDWDSDTGFSKFVEARPTYAGSDVDRSLNHEELAEHRNNYIFDPKHGPSKIHASLYNGGPRRTVYHYDTLTEKLHQINE